LNEKLAFINGELEKSDDYDERLNKLKACAAAYSECTILTAEMLNQLIERTEIGYPETDGSISRKTGKIIKQEITIIYRFINSNI
jgi:hypothetical protein